MADTIKVLAQSIPLASTLTDAYTAPSAAVISTIVACNQDGAAVNIRLSVAVAGAADALKQYLYYDTYIGPNDSLALTAGLTLAATDVIRVYSSNGEVSFNIFGTEVS